MIDLLQQLNEISISGIAKRQKDITKLFPTFFDRVQAVVDKGGVRLNNLQKDLWQFRVHSGTDDNKWYEFNFHIKDLVNLLNKYVPDKSLWTKDKQRADLRKVARAIFFDADVQIECSCPAAQYYHHYTQSRPKYDAKYGRKENRPPVKRNPNEYGILCKHGNAVLKTLPFYITTIAKWLKENYADKIKEIQDKARETETEPEVEQET
jgi:hypothetical protein